ncbi:amidohydrolase family protein [Pseudomonas sp. ACN5]|uniref:amidohydrolase family protein n=1 Tax=Pseudomonas sp. ACN5 TaxID=1920427 RepID=UPI0011439FF1
MNFGELDPESAHCFDQIVEFAKGLDFVIVIHQEIAAPGAFLEKHDPFPQLRWILDHMGGSDKSL